MSSPARAQRRRNGVPIPHSFFVANRVTVEPGEGRDDRTGRSAGLTFRVRIAGQWTHGQAQTIDLLVPGDVAAFLAGRFGEHLPPPEEEPAPDATSGD